MFFFGSGSNTSAGRALLLVDEPAGAGAVDGEDEVAMVGVKEEEECIMMEADGDAMDVGEAMDVGATDG